jgi:hypothetical protein
VFRGSRLSRSPVLVAAVPGCRSVGAPVAGHLCTRSNSGRRPKMPHRPTTVASCLRRRSSPYTCSSLEILQIRSMPQGPKVTLPMAKFSLRNLGCLYGVRVNKKGKMRNVKQKSDGWSTIKKVRSCIYMTISFEAQGTL